MPKFGALDNSIIGDYTRAEWEQKLRDQGFNCFWCGNPICDPDVARDAGVPLDSKSKAVPDHICPESRGGVDFIWNIVAACESCNRIRNNRLPGEFLQDRLAFARPVHDAGKRSTVIPLYKARQVDGAINVTAHLEISDFASQVIRNLSTAMPRMELTPEELRARKKMLLEQAAQLMISRHREALEAAGQIPLRFDPLKPVASATAESSEERQA